MPFEATCVSSLGSPLHNSDLILGEIIQLVDQPINLPVDGGDLTLEHGFGLGHLGFAGGGRPLACALWRRGVESGASCG